MDVFNKPQDGYTDEQKEFALTLHMHGPKAYGFLRNEMKFHLPHPHTLQKYEFLCLACLIDSILP